MPKMTTQKTPFISAVAPYLKRIERVLLAALSIGSVLTFWRVEAMTTIQVSLLGLAIVYFTTAFTILEIPKPIDEIYGFKELLALVIVPKVLWMCSAVSLFGGNVYTLHMEHNGFNGGLRTGGLGIFICLIILIYAFLTGTKHLNHLLPHLARAMPIFLFDFYLVFVRTNLITAA